MALVPGMRLGAYEVTAPLGAGGMGEVYRARDSKLKREVALKVLPTDVASTPERLARFRREAELLASLNHPNIAHVYGLEESGGITALIMEMVEGVDLSGRIAGGAIPIHEALLIAKQIVGALEAAHEQGIVHRDLKPGNIRVRPDGTVKVLDFGLAKAFDVAAATSHPSNAPTAMAPATAAGVILGTAAYMSPEQARGRPVDKRTDIWAFGCVLSEMLIGRRAFEGDDVTDVLARILEREPDFSALPPLTPPAIRRLLRRSLEKDRSQRLPDIGVARLEIDEALTALATGPVLPAPSPSRQPARWQERAAWLLAGVAILGASVLALLAFRGNVPAQPTVRFDVNTPPTPDAFSFALSPDGRHLAFVATADGRPHLFVRALDQVTAQPLAGTEGASYPFWSPDSRSVGFFADGKLRRKDLEGEQPQALADAPAGRGGTWNADGVIVFAPAPVVGLMRVASTGGNPVAVTQLSGDQGSHRWPQFLPDGRRFLFFVGLGQASARGVYLGSLDGGEPTRVLAGETTAWYAPPGFLLRVLQGVLVAHHFDVAQATAASESVVVAQLVGVDDGTFRSAFSVSDGGVLAYRPGTGTRRQLAWLNRAGKTLGVLGPVDDAAPSSPALSPDGRRVALSRAPEGTSDIWLIDVARDVTSRLTFDPGVDGYPVWSPDGNRLVFSSGRDGRIDLFEKTSNGTTDERPLLVTGQDKVAQDWSPDGQTLLFTAQDPKTGTGDLWALPISGTPGAPNAANSARQPFPVVQSAYDEGQAEFSPNGRWVAFVSNETGRQEVSILSFPDLSSKSLVSTGGGIFPRWRPDGRELYYLAPDMRLMAATIEPEASLASASPRAPEALFSTRLSTTGAYVFTAGIFARPQYAVASDGRFLMSVNDDAAALPITVVLNWTAGLVNNR